MGCLMDDGPVAVEADPIVEKAEQLAVAEMASISIHTERGAFIEELKTAVFPSSKPLVVIECPTSRAAVFTSFFDLLIEVPVRFSLLVPLGSRDELISVMKGILKKLPGRTIFTVALSLGKQSSRQRPSYALYVPAQDGPVTFHVGLEGCRAHASEGIRLRCTSSACCMRAADIPKDPAGLFDPDTPSERADEEIPWRTASSLISRIASIKRRPRAVTRPQTRTRERMIAPPTCSPTPRRWPCIGRC